MNAIVTENVVRKFGEVTAVDGVSFSVAPGEFVALLGPNGAGKTTLFQLLSGLFLPDVGRVEIMGHRSFRSEIAGKDLAQPRPELGMLQPERHGRLEKPELVAAIEPPAGKAQPVKGLAVLDQPGERVGQLDLAAAAGLGTGEVTKDLRLDDVAADDRQCRWRCWGPSA